MDRGNETLFNRIDRLERANRRMRIFGLALLAATFTLGAASSGQFSPVFKTQRVQIIDDKGNVRADLGLFGDVNPNPALLLYDGNGVLRTFTGIEHAFQPFTGFVTWYGSGEIATANGNNVTENTSESVEYGRSSFPGNGISATGVTVDYHDRFAGFFTNDANQKNRIFLATPAFGDGYVTLNLNDANQQARAIDYL